MRGLRSSGSGGLGWAGEAERAFDLRDEQVGDVTGIAWSYQRPLHDATQVHGLIAFFDERVNVVMDGERQERPVTPWSS
jgi:uncharacterized protein (DUF427 family)